MATLTDIVEKMAKERKVENMVSNICHKKMDADLSDLSQMVYLILLEYDKDKVVELWERGEIDFFIARIIINQFRSSNSPFHATYRKFREMSTNIDGMDWSDEN